jgi:hypothetical protein
MVENCPSCKVHRSEENQNQDSLGSTVPAGSESALREGQTCPKCGEPAHRGLCLNAPDNPEGDIEW